MARPATSRLKVNPPLGRMPTLQFCRPAELRIDPSYQRDITNGPSQTLIRKIATYWNWDLCQPLVVARRTDLTERLFVIDGQHRLEAARLRGDIDQLPCVIVNFAQVADEAASFVHLNQQRRPLSKLDVFKAAVASGDAEATAITEALSDAGLSIARTTNSSMWKPGQLVNIGGIEHAWRRRGPVATKLALRALSEAFAGVVLQYGGTLFPGIAAVCDDETGKGGFGAIKFPEFIHMLGARRQADWRRDVITMRSQHDQLGYSQAVEKVIRDAWAEHWARTRIAPQPRTPTPIRAPAPRPTIAPAAPMSDGKRWCDQCEMRVALTAATLCKSRYCKLRPALAVGR
jgi:hypothetical protein